MRVVIIGGGIAGLTIALTLRESGADVTIIDPTPGRGASWMAAGMLAPVTEAWYGEESKLALDILAIKQWKSYATNLANLSQCDLDLRTEGTIQIALDQDDAQKLTRIREFQRSMGLDVVSLTRDEVLDLEPFLTPKVSTASLISTDLSVDTRKFVTALEIAVARAGVKCVIDSTVGFEFKDSRIATVKTSHNDYSADEIVIAAGAWSGQILELLRTSANQPKLENLPNIRPIKGEILRLKSPGPSINHTLHASIHGFGVYLVPRENGEIIVGATLLERGFDTTPTAGGFYQIIRDARELLPYVNEMEVLEFCVGLRPGSPDNAPIIDRVPGIQNLTLAAGHYRSGVLLAPLNGPIVAYHLGIKTAPEGVELVALNRFSKVHS